MLKAHSPRGQYLPQQAIGHRGKFVVMIKSIKIILPKNQKAKAKLKKKLHEYEKRVEKLKKACKTDNPDITYNSFTGYKALITRRLCQRGEVQSREFAEELKEEFGRLDPDTYNNAIGVIYDYCNTGGKNVKNGTGF